MAVSSAIVWVVAAYMAALLLLGYLAARLTRSPEDFFLANRTLGAWVTAISSTAASESGWVVLGAVGMAYSSGVSALWFAPGCLLGYFLNLYLVAPALRQQAASLGALTLPEYFARRYSARGVEIRVAAVGVILLSLAGYVAAQMTATGKAMEAIVGLPYRQGILLGGLVIVVYTFSGGFRAVSWTGFVQGLIMVAALVTMPVLAVAAVGGYSSLLARLGHVDPALISVTGGKVGKELFFPSRGCWALGWDTRGNPTC